MIDFIYHAVYAVTRYMDDLNLQTTEIKNLSILDWMVEKLIATEGWGMDLYIIDLFQGSKSLCMGRVSMGKQYMFQFVSICLYQVDQLRIYMSRIDQESITALLAGNEIGIAETYDRKMLIDIQKRASSQLE